MRTPFMGKVWKLGDDMDTDIIIPTQYMTLPTIKEMARHAFEPLRPELAALIRPGDLIVAGRNFGCGSSREQAPEILLALGVAAVVAKGFARIFYRNALNNGLLVLEQAELSDVVAEGDMLTVDVARGTAGYRGRTFTLPAMPESMAAMLDAGGLVAYHRVRNGARA